MSKCQEMADSFCVILLSSMRFDEVVFSCSVILAYFDSYFICSIDFCYFRLAFPRFDLGACISIFFVQLASFLCHSIYH